MAEGVEGRPQRAPAPPGPIWRGVLQANIPLGIGFDQGKANPKQAHGQSDPRPGGRDALDQWSWARTSGVRRRRFTNPPRKHGGKEPPAGDSAWSARQTTRPLTQTAGLGQQPHQDQGHRPMHGKKAPARSISREGAACCGYTCAVPIRNSSIAVLPHQQNKTQAIPEALGALGADDSAGGGPDPPLRGPVKG